MRVNSSDVRLYSETQYKQKQTTETKYIDKEGRTQLKKVEESTRLESGIAFARNVNNGIPSESISYNNEHSYVSQKENSEFINYSEETKKNNSDLSKRDFEMENWLKGIFNTLDSVLGEMSKSIKNDLHRNSALNPDSQEYDQSGDTFKKLDSIRKDLSKTLDHQLRLMGAISETMKKFTPLNDREKSVQVNYEQSMLVESRGTIITEDGEEIQFELNVGSLQKSESISIERYQVKDPLIINFDGKAAQLQDTRFLFDLDSDGKDESIPYLNSGSGFLALDLNGDGKINDGNELFGTKSGNGFTDLAAYDEDGNMWIDENDSIFKDLSIWMQNDTNGEGKLLSLYQAGVGAIHLGNVETNAKIFGSEGQILGLVSNSGVALSESANVLNVQSIDIVV